MWLSNSVLARKETLYNEKNTLSHIKERERESKIDIDREKRIFFETKKNFFGGGGIINTVLYKTRTSQKKFRFFFLHKIIINFLINFLLCFYFCSTHIFEGIFSKKKLNNI